MNKIFISWSGNPKIAEALKRALTFAFGAMSPSIFVSSENIATGKEWFKTIKENLSDSNITIVCITKDNYEAPWLYFEAGASSFHSGTEDKPLMVVLFDVELPNGSPLKQYNHVKWERAGYAKLLADINKCLDKSTLNDTQIKAIASGNYKDVNAQINPILKEIRNRHSRKRITVFPTDKADLVTDTLYLACPMASLKEDEEYQNAQKDITRVYEAIIKFCKIPKSKIYAPAVKITQQERFDGSEKAIEDNFGIMKQAKYYVCVYNKNVVSSIIAEIGYCIALNKDIVIFLKNGVELPYLLSNSDKALNFVKIYEYDDVEDIIEIFKRNQKSALHR